jgi:Hermes transposase DNA-binding domain
MSDYGSTDNIQTKIRDQVYRTEPKEEKDHRHNPLWELFLTLTTDADGEKTAISYVSCTKCGHVSSYDSAKGGTRRLRRHADGFSGSSMLAPSVSNYFKTVKMPKVAKDEITMKCVEFVCKDLRPFSVVIDEGFMKLAQALINAGTKYGHFSRVASFPT